MPAPSNDLPIFRSSLDRRTKEHVGALYEVVLRLRECAENRDELPETLTLTRIMQCVRSGYELGGFDDPGLHDLREILENEHIDKRGAYRDAVTFGELAHLLEHRLEEIDFRLWQEWANEQCEVHEYWSESGRRVKRVRDHPGPGTVPEEEMAKLTERYTCLLLARAIEKRVEWLCDFAKMEEEATISSSERRMRERRQKAMELHKQGQTNSQIAIRLGVSEATISRDLQAADE